MGMSVLDEGQIAISTLNGKQLKGHAIKVGEGKRKLSHQSSQHKRYGFDSNRDDRGRHDKFGRNGRRF